MHSSRSGDPICRRPASPSRCPAERARSENVHTPRASETDSVPATDNETSVEFHVRLKNTFQWRLGESTRKQNTCSAYQISAVVNAAHFCPVHRFNNANLNINWSAQWKRERNAVRLNLCAIRIDYYCRKRRSAECVNREAKTRAANWNNNSLAAQFRSLAPFSASV